MKSFRFYFTDRPDPPQKTVENYSPEELDKFLQEFQPQAGSVQAVQAILAGRLSRLAWSSYSGGALGSANTDAFFDWSMWWVIFGLFWVASFAILGMLHCPACRNDLRNALGEYCPECGTKSMKKPGWPKSPHCSACEKIFEGSGRCPNFGFGLAPSAE